MATPRNSPDSFLFVDAFNVIHALPALRDTLRREGPDSARDRLAQMLSLLHDASALRVVIVLDSSSERATSEHPFGPRGLEILHAPAALTADGAIERMMARLEHPESSYAVSNDQMIRESVRACGGNALRPEELMDWVTESDRQTRLQLKRKQASNANAFGIQLDL